MLIKIVTPTKKIVDGQEVEELFVPAHKGQLNILPGHSPLVSTLTEGVLKYKLKDKSDFDVAAISWGYLEVTPQSVHILAETAESPSEIDLERAKKALAAAESTITGDSVTPEDVEKYNRKRLRALARIEAAEYE